MSPRLLFVFLFFVTAGLILRGPINAFGPMASALIESLGMSPELFGLIGGIPLFTFGVFAFLSNGLANRSLASIATLSILGIIFGALVRAYPSSLSVLVGTVIVAAAIAQINVILPVVIKTWFANSAHLMTGCLCTMIGLSSALGSFLSVPLIETFHTWQAPFIFWAAAALPALFFSRALQHEPSVQVAKTPAGATNAVLHAQSHALTIRLGLIFALQASISTLVANWLPATLAQSGTPLDEGASLVALFFIATVPGAFVTPALKRCTRSFMLPVALFVLLLAAFGAISFSKTMLLQQLAASIAGFTQGILMTLSFTLLQTESRDAEDAFRLSSRVQGLGYCLAGLAPFGTAWLLRAWANFLPNASSLHVVLGLVVLTAGAWCALYGLTTRRDLD